jgi:hypothetical protein
MRKQIAGIAIVLVLVILVSFQAPGGQERALAVGENGAVLHLPVVLRDAPPVPTPPPQPVDEPRARVNYFRALAGVPAVSFYGVLDANCFQHARYTAENNHLTHQQDPALPWASAAGQICAEKGNVWLGSASATPWPPARPVDGWMGSVGHRLWLLYPTTPTFGYGFYSAANNRAGAALDVLSTFNSAADAGYPGWPVRYPASGQQDVPASIYPITLNWLYFGPPPTVSSSTLTTAGGVPVPHEVTTALPVGHKGILILPSASLPASTTFVVSVTGSYEGVVFNYSWSFSTGTN